MDGDSVHFDLEALMAKVEADPGAPEFPAAAEALRRSGQAERAREIAEAGLASAPSRLAGRVALALTEMDLGSPARGRDELEKVLDEMLEPYRLEAEPEAPLIPVRAEPEAPLIPVRAEPEAPLIPVRAEPEAPLTPVRAEPEASPTPVVETSETARPAGFDAVGEQEIDAAFDEAEARAEEMHSPNRMAESILEAEAPFESDPPSQVDPADDILAAEGGGEAPGDFDIAASGAFATRTMAGLLEQQGDHSRATTIRSALEVEPGGAGDPTAEAWPETASQLTAAEEGESLDDATDVDFMDDAMGEVMDVAGSTAMDAAEAPDGVGTTAAMADEAHRARVLATLERWLHNLERGTA